MNWERALIGTGLADPDQMSRAEDVLPSDLTGPHQTIWAEMVALHSRGSLGARSLVESLRSSRALDTIAFEDADEQGERYIASLIRYRGEEMEEYASQVVSVATKRQLRDVAALIRSEAQDERVSVEEAIARAEERIMRLRRNRKDQGVTIADLAVSLSDRLERARNGESVAAWTPRLDNLRSVLDFVEAEDFILIAGRPGDGKSTFLRYELARLALEERQPVLLINLENSEIEIVRNVIAMMTGINKAKIKSGRLNDAEREQVAAAIGILNNTPMHIRSIGAPSAKDVTSICRYYISRHGVKLIGLDYIQLMANGDSNKVQDVSASSSALRAVALNMKVPVMAAAQLSRAIEHRGDNAEPQLSDLRESGSLEQDGTVILFKRPVWANPTAEQLRQFPENVTTVGAETVIRPNAVPMKLKVAKNRNGPIGVTEPFLFQKHLNSYRVITERTFL